MPPWLVIPRDLSTLYKAHTVFNCIEAPLTLLVRRLQIVRLCFFFHWHNYFKPWATLKRAGWFFFNCITLHFSILTCHLIDRFQKKKIVGTNTRSDVSHIYTTGFCYSCVVNEVSRITSCSCIQKCGQISRTGL